MRKAATLLFITFLLMVFYKAEGQEISRKGMLDSMKTIDQEVKKYFPRWKICETDLQIQIFKTFQLLGYPEEELDMTKIEVLAIPKTTESLYDPYEILMISCGRAYMNASEIESNLGLLVDYISGATSYQYDYVMDYPSRDYCYVEIPPNIPVTENQYAAILSYLEPSNVTHSFTISLFEQSVKLGDSYFWLKSEYGTDPVGYPFWTPGEAKILIKRPLYVNRDPNTSVQIPNLVNAFLGGGYRVKSGLESQSGIFDFLPSRTLNGATNGKLIVGFDFYMPFHPFLGLHFNIEAPIDNTLEMSIDGKAFGKYENTNNRVTFTNTGTHRLDNANLKGIVPILQTTGQVTLFYNWWFDSKKPEHYVRADFGISYAEVQEYAYYEINDNDSQKRPKGQYLTTLDANGLILYRPTEMIDWIFAKAEYRSQSAYPFGFSAQYSNQIFLGRVYIPLISPWLYLEGKYATPLRDLRPFEIEHFFMVSPVLRITI